MGAGGSLHGVGVRKEKGKAQAEISALGDGCEMPLTDMGTLELGRREVEVGRSTISFVPKALARNPSRNAQKADKYMGLDKDIFHVPRQDPAGCRQQAGVAQMRDLSDHSQETG